MKNLGLLTLLHLLVDGVCGAVLANYALQEPRLEPIIFYFGLYTVFAFGLQGPFGWLLDRHIVYLRCWLLASTMFLTLGAILPLPIGAQAILLGIGNCLFHIVGGSYVLRRFNTYTQLGLFVCSGAVGLGLGLYSIMGVGVLLGLSWCFTILLFKNLPSTVSTIKELSICANPQEKISPPILLLVAGLLFACVLLRGFGSSELDSPYIMLLPCCLALGKLLGGITCDKLGYKKTVLLIFVLGFIGLQLQGLCASLIFLLACNMTMPLTLRLAHWCKIEAPGLMFGLAASCLVPGTLFKGLVSFPPQLVLTLQFLILFVAGYVLLKQEYANV